MYVCTKLWNRQKIGNLVPIFHMQFSIICCSILPLTFHLLFMSSNCCKKKGGPLEPIPHFFKFFLQKRPSWCLSTCIHWDSKLLVPPNHEGTVWKFKKLSVTLISRVIWESRKLLHKFFHTMVGVPTLLHLSVHVGMWTSLIRYLPVCCGVLEATKQVTL